MSNNKENGYYVGQFYRIVEPVLDYRYNFSLFKCVFSSGGVSFFRRLDEESCKIVGPVLKQGLFKFQIVQNIPQKYFFAEEDWS